MLARYNVATQEPALITIIKAAIKALNQSSMDWISVYKNWLKTAADSECRIEDKKNQATEKMPNGTTRKHRSN
jgi:malate synthase